MHALALQHKIASASRVAEQEAGSTSNVQSDGGSEAEAEADAGSTSNRQSDGGSEAEAEADAGSTSNRQSDGGSEAEAEADAGSTSNRQSDGGSEAEAEADAGSTSNRQSDGGSEAEAEADAGSTSNRQSDGGSEAEAEADAGSTSNRQSDGGSEAEAEADAGSTSNRQSDGGSEAEAEADAGINCSHHNTNIIVGTSTSPSSLNDNEDQDKYFSHPVPKRPCFFFIPEADWNHLRSKQHKCRFKTLDWTNVIAQGIRSVHPFCSFAFKRHTVKAAGSIRTGPLFSCAGYCRFEECPVEVFVEVNNELSLKATVTFKGDKVWHSCNVLKRRPVRANDRPTTADVLTTKLPRSLYLDNLGKLPESVVDSGCRDQVPTPGTLKTLSWDNKRKKRSHTNDLLSLQKMHEEEQGSQDAIIQKIQMHPKGVMLWSKKMLSLFYQRCRDDIVYLDATGSIIQKEKGRSAPFYVYELVVRHPSKGSSPVPVATYVTNDHTTASVSFFLASFVTDLIRQHGQKIKTRPVMFICDGSIVLLQSLSYNFCGVSLQELLNRYYNIVTGQAPEDSIRLPILHRCLSHVMKNAKDLCKKHAPKHYHLAMHTFGAMAQATTIEELEEIIVSAAVVFSSSHSGKKVEKHFKNLQLIMTQGGRTDIEDSSIVEQEFMNDVGITSFQHHFERVIKQEEGDKDGEPNMYLSPTFIPALTKYFLPQAALWTGLLLGDLGRHGTGPVYERFTQRFNRAAQKTTQNYSQDNHTQGIMEKSQWDLKRIRFQRRRLTRLDDFVVTYKMTLNGLLREFRDSLKGKQRRYHVDEEKWKQRRQRKRGVYVSPLVKPFVMQKMKTSEKKIQTQTPTKETGEEAHQDDSNGQQHAETSLATTLQDAASQLSTLWQKEDTEVVVSVVPSQIRGQSFVIHHSELRSLRPHQWLTGEIIECYLHHTAARLNLGSTMYILNHYTASVILFEGREAVRRHSLSRIDFGKYRAIVSFVNIQNVHWKFLYVDSDRSKVYLVDPAKSAKELVESEQAAKRLRDYFNMRRACHSKTDWVDKKWKGAIMHHPVQKDSSSCGVIVIMMARLVMEAFPNMPRMDFKTTRKQMAQERTNIACEILHASVFNTDSNCAMCSTTKPPGSGPAFTDWIQCDGCCRWYHAQCLNLDKDTLKKAASEDWNCCLCK
ncbi:uncharacterized protein LOC114846544 isoform X3 [Betta splendens]|uniref:Uncharacterized protein LOC114846544 isoform X3 n=1 Tax=Betta splendens TaxID=158456 RepID=A0A6P7LD65_BETSP|nr:uncharacterized protein LOC114846544 isoform X3 [Betta splendens]